MKKHVTTVLVSVAAALGISGCHTCPPPEESLECYPICYKELQGNARSVQDDWQKFKDTQHYPYVPTRRYPKTDEIGKIVSALSYQVKHEIVIPYIELDREGLISGFYEFEADVKETVKVRNCDPETAMKLVIESWQRMPDGQEKCEKLVQAIPLLHQLRVNVQLRKAIGHLGPEVARLLTLIAKDPTFRKEYKLLENDFKKAIRGDLNSVGNSLDAISAALNVTLHLENLRKSIVFLDRYLQDKSSQREAMEKFIAENELLSKDVHQHNN